MQGKKWSSIILTFVFVLGSTSLSFGQSNGTLRGTVTLETSGKPVHNVSVTITQLKRAAETDDNGTYEFQNVPPGSYDFIAHMDRVPEVWQRGQVARAATVLADLQFSLGV